jgi:replicative DNA helicase
MSTHELMVRYAAHDSEVSVGAISKKRTDDVQNAKIAVSMRRMSDVPIRLYDQPGITVHDVRRELQAHRDTGFVVIDYVQLMHGTEKAENRNLEVAKISGDLKRLAKEFNIPVLALSQLSRKSDETDEPVLNDLRDSGSLEQDADKVIMLWLLERPQKGEGKKIGVKVAKNRMGETGVVVMYFDGATMTFKQAAEEYVPQRRTGRGRHYARRDDDLPEGW